MGLTFSKEALERAGFAADEKIALLVSPGEIRIRAVGERHRLELSQQEIKALVSGSLDSKDGKSVVAKAKSLLKERR